MANNNPDPEGGPTGEIILLAITGGLLVLGGVFYYSALPPSLTVVEDDPAFESVGMVGEHTIEVTLATSQSDATSVVVLSEQGRVTDWHSLATGERTFTVDTAHTGFGGAVTGNYTIQLVSSDGAVVGKTVVRI